MSPSIWQILIILAIVLLLFGTKRLRNIGSDLGAAIKGFRKGMSDAGDESEERPSQRLGQDADRSASSADRNESERTPR